MHRGSDVRCQFPYAKRVLASWKPEIDFDPKWHIHFEFNLDSFFFFLSKLISCIQHRVKCFFFQTSSRYFFICRKTFLPYVYAFF